MSRRVARQPDRDGGTAALVQLESARQTLLRSDPKITPLEREALALIGIRTARQLAAFDDAAALQLARLLRFAEVERLARPGALTRAVHQVERALRQPFFETWIASALLPTPALLLAGATGPRNAARAMAAGDWLTSYSYAVPEALRLLANEVQAADGRARIDAIRELARSAGRRYTGGRPQRGDAVARSSRTSLLAGVGIPSSPRSRRGGRRPAQTLPRVRLEEKAALGRHALGNRVQ